MPYSLHDDNLARDGRWDVLARVGRPDGPDLLEMPTAARRAAVVRLERRKRDLILSLYLMTLESSACKQDGYITLEAALVCCMDDASMVKALATPVCGEPAVLHRKGEACGKKNCVDSSPPWREGFDFRVCAFLKRNPSRAEYERNKDQVAELRSPQLRALLLERDGLFCRYCRSGPLSAKAGKADERRKVLHKDHVDPDKPAGPAAVNLVTACASCNEHKANRTPFEADLVLMEPPTPEQLVEWTAQGLVMFDPPWITPAINNRITDQISDESVMDHRLISDPVGDPDVDSSGDPTTPDAASPRPETAPDLPDHLMDQRQEGSLSGRAGGLVRDGPTGARGQPVRDATYPDIYHGRSRPPATPGGPT